MEAIDEAGRLTGRLVPAEPLSAGDLKDAALRGGPRGDEYRWPPTSGNAWTRRYLDAVMPIPEDVYRTCPDLYLAGHAPLYGRVALVPEPKSRWRLHGANNTWRSCWSDRVAEQCRMWDACFASLASHARRMGATPEVERWALGSWWHRLARVTRELETLIPEGQRFILVDDGQWETGEILPGRRAIPLPERDGVYWGPPADERVALAEFERLREGGAGFIVFGWPAFWWLEHYRMLADSLRTRFRCVASNERIIAFDLNQPA
jgi:hypothetical protein